MKQPAYHPQVATVDEKRVPTAEERRQLLHAWNDTAAPFAADRCIHEFFEAQVVRSPEAIAVAFCDRHWTYRELNDHADALAGRLRGAGVGPGSIVAISLHRSLELMATLLAVFKAGGAYLPLDPSYPIERLSYMIGDARPAVIVVSEKTESLFAACSAPLIRIDAAAREIPAAGASQPTIPARSSDAAYVLYTSGSTGKPKGVVVTHRNVSNFFTAMDGVIDVAPGVWLAVTSINFDISVFELFWTLARGFRVVLQEESQCVTQTSSPWSLAAQMKRHGVTHLQCTPFLAAMLVNDPDAVTGLRQLRRMMVGGEPLPLDLGRRLADVVGGELHNLYGPTETTVWSSSQRVTAGDAQILIGRPVANTQMYVLDPALELMPPGTIGELYIGGEGLAREYLHQPEFTRERFITHAFTPGKPERLYRTGDLARHTVDGRLEFMGRVDQQVKIRGMRVELGEIETVLRKHPGVRDAAVVVQGEGADDKRLVAFVIAATPTAPPNVPVLLDWVGLTLPRGVVPSTVVFLAEFPKTLNGKLDRRALSAIEARPAPVADISAPDAHFEHELAAIWSDVLGVAHVDVEDRFFDIGGHSLLMVEVHDRLRDKLGQEVPLLDLFRYPTIRSLATHLRHSAPADAPASAGARRGQLRQRSANRSSGSLRRAAALKKSA